LGRNEENFVPPADAAALIVTQTNFNIFVAEHQRC
jgi:hypothetical protein